MEVWPCQVSVSSPMLVRLHWAFPWLITSFCIMVWFMVICMAIIVAPRLRNGQAHLNTPLRRGIGMSTNSYSSSSIPFSSGRRGQSSVPSQQQEQRQQLSDVPETGNMMASMRRESQVGRLGDSAASARNQSGERGRREDRKRRMSSTPTEGGASAASIHSTRLYRVSLSPNSSNSNR